LIFQLAMPLLFTFLIGQAIGDFGGSSNSSTTVIWTLTVANEDEGELGTLLLNQLQADPVLDVREVAGETAVTQVENEEAEAALIIPPNFSARLLAADGVALDIYSDPANNQTVQPIAEAIKGAATQLQGSLQAVAVSEQSAKALGLFTEDEDTTAYQLVAIAAAEAAWQQPPVAVQVNEDEIIIATENTIPTGVNQTSPGMMAMFVTFGMIGGAAVLVQERQWGTLRRLAIMPIGKSSIIGGKLLGIVAAGIGQMLILIVAGAVLFGVGWGNSPPALLLMIVTFAFAMSALSMMMAALVKTVSQANALGTILVMSMAALGGAWWPLEIVPDFMQAIARLSPIYWAMNGFHDIITRGLGLTAVLPDAAVLVGFTAVFLFIGIWRFKFE
jgi:ABC-2 type transport system permease protein